MVTNAAIVVGVDGSPSANSAVGWAARAAGMRNSTLTVVYAAAPVMGAWTAPPVAAAVLDWQQELGREIVDAAVQIAKQSTDGSLRITTELVSEATVPVLVQMSRDAQMVVVGCRGRGAVARTLLGSVSMGLVHGAHCPVAVIHNESPSTKNLNRAPVLLGFDGSPASESATALAFDEASRRRVELVVLHAWWGSGAFELPLDWDALRPEGVLIADRYPAFTDSGESLEVDVCSMACAGHQRICRQVRGGKAPSCARHPGAERRGRATARGLHHQPPLARH